MVFLSFALLRKQSTQGIISHSHHCGARTQSQVCVVGGCALEASSLQAPFSFCAYSLNTVLC